MRSIALTELKRNPWRLLAAGAVALAVAGAIWATAAGWQRRAPAAGEPSGASSGTPQPSALSPQPAGPGEAARVGELEITPEAMELAEIRVAPAGQQVVPERLPVNGTIEAGGDRLVKITPRVAGKVVSVTVVAGDSVRAGQTLAVIESTDLARAQADYEHARLGLGLARKNLARQRDLARLGAFSTPALEQARRDSEAARGEASAAAGDAGAAKNQVAEAESEVAAREGEVAAAEADTSTAEGDIAGAESQIGAREAALSQAQAQQQVAEKAFQRADRLLQEGVVSRGQWEREQAALQRAAADVEAARANLRQAQVAVETARSRQRAALAKARGAAARVRQARTAVETARSRQDQAEARQAAAKKQAEIAAQALAREEAVAKGGYRTSKELVEAESALQETEHELEHSGRSVRLLGAKPGEGTTIPLVTPIDGRVQERNASLGETVDPEHALFTVINLNLVWAQLTIPPADLARIRLGQRVELASETAPGRTYGGVVSAIDSAADEKTRAVRVRCALANAGGALRPETFVRGFLVTDVRREQVTVPTGALQEHTGKPTVYVADSRRPGAFEVRHVTLGAEGKGWREITTGLRFGERVAVNGTFYLKSEALKSSLSDSCCGVKKGGG